MSSPSVADLASLTDKPFELLQVIERRCLELAQSSADQGGDSSEWVGIGFKMGAENMLVARDDIREIMMVPDSMSRVPGAKAWIRGLANLRGQLLPIVDLSHYLGSGSTKVSRGARVLVLNSREFTVGILVDEVFGFRRFLNSEFCSDVPQIEICSERYIDGAFARNNDFWPVFSMSTLLATQDFQHAGEQ
ncbi:MAG: chemotaxis protein CheW [Gammaproteobacteria bacterium]|nr:chemotaxis protein CheW [Gammaproteobacteria bacterium]